MDGILFEGELFGKKVRIVLYNLDHKKAKRIFFKAYKEGLRLQKIFNFFDKESELSDLNLRRKRKVSKELLEVIRNSIRFSGMTEGAYDVTLGKKILNRKMGKGEIQVSSSYKDVDIKENLILLKNDEALVDLGSIAKGFITDKMAEILKKEGVKDFIIDSRGDILFSGNIEHIIGIANPRDKGKDIKKIKMKNKAVATSGDYNQYYGDYKNSHIVNSKSIISATIIADTLQEADAFSTALFVSEEAIRKKLIHENPQIKVFLIKDDLEAETYNGFEEVIYE